MELKINIGIEEILHIVRQLPRNEFTKLKRELENEPVNNLLPKEKLKQFLLDAPVFGKEQINRIQNTRNKINTWRTK